MTRCAAVGPHAHPVRQLLGHGQCLGWLERRPGTLANIVEREARVILDRSAPCTYISLKARRSAARTETRLVHLGRPLFRGRRRSIGFGRDRSARAARSATAA